MLRFFNLILLCSLCASISSQEDSPIDASEFRDPTAETQDTVDRIIFTADTLTHAFIDGRSLDTMINNVEMIQDSLAMYCDRAYMVDQLYVDAYENVVIIHEDSVHIFADTGAYNGFTKIANLYGQVVLEEGNRSVYTTALTYDIAAKQASYNVGGTLIEQDRTIVSLNGHYDTQLHEAILSGNVRFHDSTMTMVTDSILYYSDAEQLVIVAPTQINQDSVEVYCEAGVYRLKVKQGVLSSNVQVKTEEETITSGILNIDGDKQVYTFWIDPIALVTDGRATADTIIFYKAENRVELLGNAVYAGATERIEAPFISYNLDTEEYETEGKAKIKNEGAEVDANDISSTEEGATLLQGDVKILDFDGGTTIRSDEAIMTDSVMKVFSVGKQAEMDYKMAEDTLFLKADTLMSIESFAKTDSAKQVYHAIDKVSLITSDVAGISGYFTYDKADSIIVMTDQPVLWADSVQLTADTIIIYLSNNEVTRIDQVGNAFILSPDENVNFNQIKCESIRNVITDGKIDSTFASRNVELCYLVLKDHEYQAVNIMQASAMQFTFFNGDISTMRITGSQTSNMYEYKSGMDIKQYYLQGYRWRIEELPTRESPILANEIIQIPNIDIIKE